MKKNKLDLMFLEYEKIFRILHGIYNFEHSDAQPSCQFYNVVGAYILDEVYGIKARPMLGAAIIKVDDITNNAMAFAHPDFEICSSDEDHFHCWIETPHHIIDFTSPVYSEYRNTPGVTKRLMFQKPYN